LALACLAVATAPERNTHPCNTKQSCREALWLGQFEVIRISERKLLRNPTSDVAYLYFFCISVLTLNPFHHLKMFEI
jgi:hypothetical protein